MDDDDAMVLTDAIELAVAEWRYDRRNTEAIWELPPLDDEDEDE